MAVPKKKTSKSRRGMRNAHRAIKKQNILIDKDSGENVLAHHMSLKDGTYKGRQIIKKNILRQLQEEEQD